MSNKVNVVICGEIITLVSDEEEAHLQRIARYIDQKMADLVSANITASINERVRTLLIALNLADDYFKTTDSYARLSAEHERYIDELGRMEQENILLRDKIRELQGELTRTQVEFEAFLSEFDSAKSSDDAKILPSPWSEQRKVR